MPKRSERSHCNKKVSWEAPYTLYNRNFYSLDFGTFSLPSVSQLTSETRWVNIEKRTRHFTETFFYGKYSSSVCLKVSKEKKNCWNNRLHCIQKFVFFFFLYTVNFTEFLVFHLKFFLCLSIRSFVFVVTHKTSRVFMNN